MKFRNLLFVAWIGIIVTSISTDVHAAPEGSAVPYRLLAHTTLTRTTTVGDGPSQSITSIITGTFTVTKVRSPLDWDVYSLTNLHWLIDYLTNVVGIFSSGSYSVTQRFGNTKQLQMTLVVNGVSVQLDSGAVPNDQNWPILDIIARGNTTNGIATTNYELHLIAAPELQVMRYRLLEGSYFVDDCLICGRPFIPEPMRGYFDLVLIDNNSILNRYVLRELNFKTSNEFNLRTLNGDGAFQFGGEVALQQAMTLNLNVFSSAQNTNQSKTFTNSSATVTKLWPVIEVDLDETKGTFGSTYRLHLIAAPVREIWFSTVANFTPGSGTVTNKAVSPGDILADSGRVVAPYAQLAQAVGLNPTNAPGVDAFTPVAGGSIQFSINTDATSTTLGQLHHGDLLSDSGKRVKQSQDLIGAFSPTPIVPDVGLDAIQVLDSGEILFSIRSNIFSEQKSILLSRGDLLSDKGEIKRTNKQLLERFHPDTANHDYGLDSIYVWPSGEIWFSTEEGFNDQQLGGISDGDLLSNQGYVVFRNLELVSAFAPLEKVSNFGFDSLFVVTDFSAASTNAPVGPKLLTPLIDGSRKQVAVSWSGSGRVSQIESTSDLMLPFVAASPILTGTRWTDLRAPSTNSAVFYRARQW